MHKYDRAVNKENCKESACYFLIHILNNIYKTRSTQRAQTSLAEADHYSHIAHCKNVESWLWKTTHPLKKKKKKKKKVLDHYLHDDLGMLPLLRYFFLLIYSSYNTQITTKI